MKRKILCVIKTTLLLLSLAGCGMSDSYIPKGYEKTEEHFDPAPTQDHVDYCKYFYNNSDLFKNNEDYETVSESDVDIVRCYFENFAGYMNAGGRLGEYDFDDSCVSEGDYVHIYTKEGEKIGTGEYNKYDHYTVYFFDTDSNVLYYIHANI
jgi:sRNA-binding regulator protein Hfq